MPEQHNSSLAYIKTKIGSFALTEKMRGDMGVEPKNMLVRLDSEEVAEHKDELTDTKVFCKKTKTGARFCIFKNPQVEIEAMEMVLPSWKYSLMAKNKQEPTLEEAREKKKNAFLVIACKPESFCKKEGYIK